MQLFGGRFSGGHYPRWELSWGNYLRGGAIVLGGQKVLLHHIVINKKWKNSALHCEDYNIFCVRKYDNRIVSAKFWLNL